MAETITVASSAITIIDTTDQNQLSAYLTSNLPTIQTRTSNGTKYDPDWTASPNLRIVLHAFYNQKEINYDDTKYTKTWYVQDGIGTRTPIDMDTSRTLIVKTNSLQNSSSGMLTYICEIKLDDVNKIEAQITYTLVTEAKGVTFEVYAPGGTVFLNQSGSLALQTNKYFGADVITSGATFQWYKYTNTNWAAISGATKDSLTVNGSDVLNIASYKCEMTYRGVKYIGVITLQDKSDTYISEIYTIGGNVFKNGTGGCATYVIVRANGKEVDPLAGPISAVAPSNPKEGDYWYKIIDSQDKISEQRYSSKNVWYSSDSDENDQFTNIPQTLKYIWSLLDKNGNDMNFHDGSDVKLGKVIYMSCSDINETGTLQCDVRSACTLKITTQPNNISATQGSSVTLSVAAEGSNVRYKWQWRENSSSAWDAWSRELSTSTNTFEAKSNRNGYQFRCRIHDGSGDVVYSKIVTLTVT